MNPRNGIYYWKCDRPAAFHGLRGKAERPISPEAIKELASVLARRFKTSAVDLAPGGGQGNHQTFLLSIGSQKAFLRIENGPEADDYIEAESYLLTKVRELGIPAPAVLDFDATRQEVSFAWQLLEFIPEPDLNQQYKDGQLDLRSIMYQIGRNIAHWQTIAPANYGPFDTRALRERGELRGYHQSYPSYFRTRLDAHLSFLVNHHFLTSDKAHQINREIEKYRSLLELNQGCLVHKDLALWNVHGSPGEITAFIDWDDAVSGDTMDDVSLLACFHDGIALKGVLDGYTSIRPLGEDYRRRFWLHLLRNMIFKAVIRVGAGYFNQSDGFFLIGKGEGGSELKRFTLERIDSALEGLRADADVAVLP